MAGLVTNLVLGTVKRLIMSLGLNCPSGRYPPATLLDRQPPANQPGLGPLLFFLRRLYGCQLL